MTEQNEPSTPPSSHRAPDLRLSPAEVRSVETAMKEILEGFSWSLSPQGHEYWEQVVNNLAGLIGRDPSAY